MHVCMYQRPWVTHFLYRPYWWREQVLETLVCNLTSKAQVAREYFNAFLRRKIFGSTVVVFFVVMLRHNTSRK